MDDFVFPRRSKKKRKNRNEGVLLTFSEKFERERRTLLEDKEWLAAVHEMIESALNAKQWSKRPQLRCLGLGSPSESRSARLQLAFILEIMMRVNIPVEDAVFYDPVFTAEDMNGMQALGLSVINGDEAKAALHPLPGPTILFMPHCDIELHQKVMESNWSFSGLRKLLMIGNPLEQYPLTTEKERLETVFSAVGAIAHCRHWDSRAIPDTLSDDKAFVALCVQYIRCDIDENELSALFAKE